MKQTINSKKLKKGILIICSYLVLSIILQIPFLFLPEKLFYLFTYLSLAIIYIIYFKNDLKQELISLKKNYKTILKTTFKYWLIGLSIMIISSFIINFLNIPSNTTNQETNITLLQRMPIIATIIMAILAPITEELVFRKGLHKFTTNKHTYAITSGIIFASIHLISSFTSLSDIIMIIHLIPYSAVGIAFGYAYHKTDNIYGTIIFHTIHNLLSILQLILIGGIL